MAMSSRAGGTPQKPDHPPTRCRSQAKVWFRRHYSFQSLVRARDQKRGSESNSGAEKEKLTPGKEAKKSDRTRGLLIYQEKERGRAVAEGIVGTCIRRKNVDALLRRESWERGTRGLLIYQEKERGRAVVEGIVGTWVSGCKRIAT
uniref:PDI(Protein disulfide isomerase)-like protein n=1 Tax=Oryza sativa subsp. japonica TaxID=39947 RepID=Q8H3B9_ORYSJ|nr:PDI(protein disulfide isomerase)-like protein [Oryza sativa Japonica Group]